MKSYCQTGRFAKGKSDFPSGVLEQLAVATETEVADLDTYFWSGRTARRHRAEVREFLGVRRLTQRDLAEASAFAVADLCPHGLPRGVMAERVISWFFERKVACPEDSELDRLIAVARRRFEEQMLDATARLLSAEHR